MKSQKDASKAHIFSIYCGCYNKLLTNSVTLNIGNSEAYGYLTNKNVLEKVYKGLVEIWHPDKGLVRCNDDEILSDTF